MQTVSKLTLSSTFPPKHDFRPLIGKDVLMVSGQVTAIKINIHPVYGESLGFVGKFFGVNLIDGKPYESQIFYPSKSFAMMIKERIDAGEVVVEFKAKFGVAESSKSPLGYAWVETPIFDEDSRARQEEIRQALIKASQQYVALAAPATESETKKSKGKS